MSESFWESKIIRVTKFEFMRFAYTGGTHEADFKNCNFVFFDLKR